MNLKTLKFQKKLDDDYDPVKIAHAPIFISSRQSQQETTMQEKDGSFADEVQWEINRMRNSLNALTLKNFMFDVKNEGEEEIIRMEVKDIPSNEEQPSFRRSTSKHRHDTDRAQSGMINQDDVIKALSQEKLNETERPMRQKPKVKFAGDDEDEIDSHPKTLKDSSRESDEVATINSDLPWQKKNRGHKSVTPYFKPTNKIKALSHENVSELPKSLSFKPIVSSQSIEDINQEIVRPVPLFASKSYQELVVQHEPFDEFRTKSSDDLLLDNIDGIQKIKESKKHRLLRMRSTSNDRLDKHSSDQVVYENLNYEAPLSADNVTMRNKKKKPMPQPRLSADVNESKKLSSSKTIVYVLDKDRDEFVLQSPNDLEDAYENVLAENNVDAYRDSDYFKYLLNSREDCKSYRHLNSYYSHKNWCISHPHNTEEY